MRIPTRTALLLLLLVLTAASSAPAGYDIGKPKETLKARIQPIVRRGRSDAPVPVDVELNWEATRLLEGRLDLVVRDGREVLGRYCSAEMALTPGTQAFRMMLPAMSMSGTERNAMVHAQFMGTKKVFPLGLYPVFLPSRMMRSLVICIVQPGGRTGTATHAIVQSLQLERFDPNAEKAGDRSLVTSPVYLSPEDLPAHPIGFCSFDMILLPADGLRALRSRQLDALARWVRAGGSVCVVAGEQIETHHAEFVNALADDKGPALVPSASGGFQLAEPFRTPVLRTFRSGIGRVVLVCKPQEWEKALQSPDWRRATAFLWKARKDQADAMAKTGHWTKRSDSQQKEVDIVYGDHETPPPRFTHVPIHMGDDFLTSILPRRVRLIPIALVGLILVLFVLAVAPGDYAVLGIFKRRQLTWISFPLLCIGFMLVTLMAARHYLGGADQQGAIVLVDIGRGGRVLRTNRVEVLFAAKGKMIRREVREGLYASLDLGGFKQYRSWDDDGGPDDALPFYQGRIPAHFTADREVRQWTPWCNRTSHVGGREQVPALAWDKLTWNPSRTKVELLGNGSFDGVILQYLGDHGSETVHGDPYGALGELFELGGVLKRISVRSRAGLFHIVSQVSPNGGDNFEDLALLDSTDKYQRLIVAITRRGTDYIVFRRLYQGAE